MFYEDGSFFYPAFPDDPFYNDFTTGEDAVLPMNQFLDGGPTALAEFMKNIAGDTPFGFAYGDDL